jgi:60S ribosome subunit biogenesis protein NIP7
MLITRLEASQKGVICFARDFCRRLVRLLTSSLRLVVVAVASLDYCVFVLFQYNQLLVIMRPLTEEETKTLFLKLSEFIGKSIERLINRSDERHCFRLLKDRVYYISESLMKASTSIAKDDLLHAGTCLGKFSKSGKFRLHITALDYLAQYAKYKVWVKPSNEMSFLYGNHVTKSGLARMTEGTPQYAGVVVYSMSDIPLGFGVAAQSTDHCQTLEPTGNVVLHQADIGDYLRGLEDDMF